MFQELVQKYITSVEDGKNYIELLKKFREAVAENDKFHGKNYSQLLKSVLSVGEDGLYSNNLRFIFELIQNVDDCDYEKTDFCCLDMKFDFYRDQIILTYNEKGFTPFNVFAITGIAEAAKNISSTKNEIGEKGIGDFSLLNCQKITLLFLFIILQIILRVHRWYCMCRIKQKKYMRRSKSSTANKKHFSARILFFFLIS